MEAKQTENILPAELHALAGRLAEVVRDLTEAQRAAEEAAQAYQAAATHGGDTGGAWTTKESAQARVAALQRQRATLEETLTAALRRELKSNAPAPSEARRLDREATAKATGEAVQLLHEAHNLLLKARELFTTDGGHVRALSGEINLVAKHLSERSTFAGALPAHGPTIPNGVIMAAHAVKDTLDIYQR
ncbi:MAG: hypothetical protein H3C30_13635 [Candidatus Hydrogenedentes bacterium]|nr:hypothetical protein [Candidatus Hydrogenedentota bacterium]